MRKVTMQSSLLNFIGVVALAGLFSSCSTKPKPQTLMPTPAVYLSGELHPFEHLPKAEKTAKMKVFFATNRKGKPPYGGAIDKTLRYGVAEVEIGLRGESWASLEEASTTHPRPEPMPIRLLQSREIEKDTEVGSGEWLREVNAAIGKTKSKDVVIYIHGAKVGFEHSCAFAAELKHFAGRDVTAMAFDWPTHREILSYLDRVDVSHARASSAKLADMIELLSSNTQAKKIHLVSWSAGARVLSRALDDLGKRGDDYDLGSVVFAAGDVPEKDFGERLPAIHRLAERVTVYVSDNDFALKWSARLMFGGKRLGVEWKKVGAEQIRLLREHPKLEIVDASYGKKKRGFDIQGHRYWFQHPWVNSDLVIALRTDQPAVKRGLTPSKQKGLYYFAPGYDRKIGKVAVGLTGGSW